MKQNLINSMMSWNQKHLEIMQTLFNQSGATGKLTTDIHLAALAMEHKSVLISNDTDFARFPNLKWHNPLKD